MFRDIGAMQKGGMDIGAIEKEVVAAPSGRVMSSLADGGGLAGSGGIAGAKGGLAG